MERESTDVAAWIQYMPEACRVAFDTALKEGMTSPDCLRRAREELVALLEGQLRVDQLSHELGVEFLLDSPMPWVGSAQGQVAGARPSYSVASGDVTPTTAVIWARAIGRQRAVMSVEVSTDANFAPGATRPGGTAWIDANTDYTGKILLSGLTPRTVYH